MVIPSIPNTKCPSIATHRPDHVKNQGMKTARLIKCTAVRTVACAHKIFEGCVASGRGNSPRAIFLSALSAVEVADAEGFEPGIPEVSVWFAMGESDMARIVHLFGAIVQKIWSIWLKNTSFHDLSLNSTGFSTWNAGWEIGDNMRHCKYCVVTGYNRLYIKR